MVPARLHLSNPGIGATVTIMRHLIGFDFVLP
jgi:hypothetical protein